MPRSCSSCGAEVSADGRFCHSCGAPLWKTCHACGAEQVAEAAFCSSCGAALQVGVRRAGEVPEHEERRVVTVLFADLAGSTALGERLEPEDVRTLQGELFELVNTEVERYGGLSEKFVGDAVLAVFGVPQTHEDDAERALRAALAIREEFPALAARVRTRYGGDVGLRIGVNTGEVIAGREAAARGELVVSGDAVNVAARLQQLAEPGTVLVGERTRLATHRVVSYRGPVELDAKGKRDPLAAWEAVAAETPAVRGRRFAAPLVGRDEDLALLRLTARRVEREGTPQLVTIFGHAGVGKSRLVDEFCASLDNALIATGRCVPYGDGITYLPLAEIAGKLTGIRDDEPAEVAHEKLRRWIVATVPESQVEPAAAALAWTLGLTLPDGGAGLAESDARRTLHQGWAAVMSALGSAQLLVLVLDDIHWASEPLLDLVEEVVDALGDCAVLVLCPSRPELLDVRPTWGTGRLTSSSLTLSPLGPSDADVLLRALLEADSLPEPVARAILEPAEGNPFFVEEMLSMLLERGALERQDGGWRPTLRLADVEVPDSIHGVIAARLDLLEAHEREGLRRCSVMGRTFWPSAVGIADDLIAGLGGRALVFEQGGTSFSGAREFAFKHALTHEVAYATLPRGDRRELHRRVARWIGELVPDRRAETTELIAYHYDQALAHGGHDPELAERAFEAALAAARAAAWRGAFSTAEPMLLRALVLAPSPPARERALLLTGRVDVARGRYEQAIERLEEVIATAEARADAGVAAEALGWKSRACWLSGRWREALNSGEAAVAKLEGLADSPALAWALARLSQIQMLRGLPVTEATAQRAIDLARRTGEQGAEANARINLFTQRTNSTGEAPPFAEVSEIVALAKEAGAHDESVRAVVNWLWSAWLTNPLDVVETAVVGALPGLRVGLTTEFFAQYLELSLAALVYVPAGRWEEADEVARKVDEHTSASNRLVWLWIVTGLALRRGDLEQVDGLLPGFREAALASEEPQRILPMASVAIPRALLAGQPEVVRELADVVVGLDPMSVSSSAALSIARVLAAQGESVRIERLLRTLGTSAGQMQQATSETASALIAILEGRPHDAAGMLASAEDAYRTFGRHYDAACVALEVARALEAAGDAGAAAAAGARAAAVLEPLGCVNPW